VKLCIFGLTVSSSWGNGHATLWRGLIRALTRRGWRVTFFERDVSYYAGARDLNGIQGGELVFYSDWNEVRRKAECEIAEADVAVVTSYCPDAIAATGLVLDAASALRVFYDLDTPVTLSLLKRSSQPDYVGDGGLAGFDLVLSYTGGEALTELGTALGARSTAALYGHVDPGQYGPAEARFDFAGDLSYLGTYAADRQADVEQYLVGPARLRPDCRFVIGGAQYPHDFPWTSVLCVVAADAQCDTPRHGRDGLVSVGSPLRSGSLRYGDRNRHLAGSRGLLRTRPRGHRGAEHG
jgi:spore maturation protein CgeB